MARMCTVCGKGPVTGNNVSHANNRTKRRWYPNLQTVRVRSGRAQAGPGLHAVHQTNRIKKAPRRPSPASEGRGMHSKKGTPRVPFRISEERKGRSLGQQLDPGDVRPVASR